jgi:hypothetical protein
VINPLVYLVYKQSGLAIWSDRKSPYADIAEYYHSLLHRKPSTLNGFQGRSELPYKQMALVYGFEPSGRLETSKDSYIWSPITSDWRHRFPRRNDSILSMRKFITQMGSRSVNNLHLCPKSLRLPSVVTHSALLRYPQSFSYSGLLTRSCTLSSTAWEEML